MTQYIDKSALVAEIDRRGNICKKVVLDLRTEENKDYYQGKAEAYKEALDFIDTLEVKEVDLEKEFDNYAKDILVCDVQFEPFTHLYNCAKYFYELGLAQKGE